jgi:hypothetical protein
MRPLGVGRAPRGDGAARRESRSAPSLCSISKQGLRAVSLLYPAYYFVYSLILDAELRRSRQRAGD